MQALYQLDVQAKQLLGQMPQFFAESERDRQVCELAWKWSKGTWENLAVCDEIIGASAIKWDVRRLSQVDRSILRLSAYQLKFCSEIPPKVVINEAIELAKKYGTEKSAPFINGVLDAAAKKLKACEPK